MRCIGSTIKSETGGQKARTFLSGVGGLGTGAALGAGIGGAGALGVNALAGRQVVSPRQAATFGGIAGGSLGGGVGALIGGNHGQSDVALGKLHEQIYKREK